MLLTSRKFLIIHLEVSILLFTFADVMLGQASAIKVRNQVSEYPPLSKLAGCFFVPHVLAAKIQIILDIATIQSEKILSHLPILLIPVSCGKATDWRTQFGNRRCFYLSRNIGVVLLNEQDKSFLF
jgi:hypothetical protein